MFFAAVGFRNGLRYGPVPVREALAREAELSLSDGATTTPRGHFLAPLLAMEGRFDEARSQLEDARAYLRERGMSFRAWEYRAHCRVRSNFLAEDYEAAATRA